MEPHIQAIPALGKLMPAKCYDTVGVAPLIRDIEFVAMLADKAFDSNWIVEETSEDCHFASPLAKGTAEDRQ